MTFTRRTLPADGRYIAARDIDFGDWKVAEGEPFPWRERGMDERDVQRRWWSGELEAAPAVTSPVGDGESVPAGERRQVVIDGKPVTLTAGERVIVETPAEKLTRAERRVQRRQG